MSITILSIARIIANQLVRLFIAYRNVAITLFLGCFITVFAVVALNVPNIEWDLLPYLANATQLAFDVTSVEQLHTNIYQSVAQSLPQESFDKLVNSPTRIMWFEDYQEFHQMMHFFYDTRVAYIGALSVLLKMGINPIVAILSFSVVCSVLSILLLLRLVPVKVPTGLYFALPFLTLAFGLLDVARLATPDALATLVTIGVYALLLRNKVVPLLILLPLIVFVRTDLILIVALFLTYFLFFRNAPKLATIVSGIAALSAYFIINNFIVDADPWSTLIAFNYADIPSYRTGFEYTVTSEIYLDYIKEGLLSFSYTPIASVFFGLALTGIALYGTQFFVGTSNHQPSTLHCDLLFLLLSSVLYLVVHFLLFPVMWVRFFAAQYTLVAVVVVWTTLSILAERNYSERKDFDLLR